MKNIYFHPHIPTAEANRIARAQGGILVCVNDSLRIQKAPPGMFKSAATVFFKKSTEVDHVQINS